MKLVGKLSTALAAAGLASVFLAPQLGAQAQLCDGQPVTVTGTAGDDVLEGTAGADVIFAAQGDDIIFGFGGDDIICAGQGNDIVMGGQGFDVIFGAQGNDVLFAADGSTEADRADTAGSRMFGGAGNDLIVGSNRWDRMQGGLGVDNLQGFEGRDWMRAGGDNDFVDGGGGIDDMHGGNGADRMRSTTGDTVRGSNGNDLCEINGTPERQVSCTTDANAYSTARHEPVMAPTESGVEQGLLYINQLFNNRNSERLVDTEAAGCDGDVSVWEEGFATNTSVLGDGWSVGRDITDVSFSNRFLVMVNLRTRFYNGNRELVVLQDGAQFLIYERGAWRSLDNSCV